MNADGAVIDSRVEPITHPQDQYISVHPRSSAAENSFPVGLPSGVRRIVWARGYDGVHGIGVLARIAHTGADDGERHRHAATIAAWTGTAADARPVRNVFTPIPQAAICRRHRPPQEPPWPTSSCPRPPSSPSRLP